MLGCIFQIAHKASLINDLKMTNLLYGKYEVNSSTLCLKTKCLLSININKEGFIMKIETTIEAYLHKMLPYQRDGGSMITNLLSSDKEYSLLKINGHGELVPDELKASIILSIKGYTSTKDNAIKVYKEYLNFIKTQYNIEIELEFPPIPISIEFERIMFIAKYLQDPNHKIEELYNMLWVGKDTIDDDIKKLRGMTDNPIQVCGKKFVIEDPKRRNGRVIMSSTAHPVLLTSNLTQIIVTLKGLRLMSKESAFRNYANDMAKSIWTQLSEYAKKRIIFVLSDLLPDEVQWYTSLEEELNNSFLSERMCSDTEGVGCVLDCLKNQKKCFIEYQEEDGSIKIYSDCTIENYLGDTIRILSGGQKIELSLDNILRSSYTIEELI